MSVLKSVAVEPPALIIERRCSGRAVAGLGKNAMTANILVLAMVRLLCGHELLLR